MSGDFRLRSIGKIRVEMALLKGQMDNGIVVADEFDTRPAERRVEHHVCLGSMSLGTMLAKIILGQCK